MMVYQIDGGPPRYLLLQPGQPEDLGYIWI